jgi:flagellar basal body-associated protein FliL
MWYNHRMKTKTYVIVAVLVVAVCVAAYFWFSAKQNQPTAPTGPTTEHPAPPVTVTGPITASSYGKDATGTKNATTVTPLAPITTAQLGIIMGIAKPVPGTKPNYALIKIALYDPKTNKLLTSATPAADGSYKFIVEPGEYVLNLASGTDSSEQLPERIYAGVGETLNINFFVN